VITLKTAPCGSASVAIRPISTSIGSFQVGVFGSLTRRAPMWLRACQSATGAPVGSITNAMRPASTTSNGSIATMPPAGATLATAASTSSVASSA